MAESWKATFSFSSIIQQYIKLQSTVVSAVKNVASNTCQATPGKFLLLQFQMSQVTQIGESISNLINQIQGVIKNTITNQRVQG